MAGLLAAGALAGPAGLRLVTSSSATQVLAELGVVLLLFTIGLEFSLDQLRSIFKQVAVGGCPFALADRRFRCPEAAGVGGGGGSARLDGV